MCENHKYASIFHRAPPVEMILARTLYRTAPNFQGTKVCGSDSNRLRGSVSKFFTCTLFDAGAQLWFTVRLGN